MLSFYTDSALQRQVTSLTPKKFLVPEDGAVKTTRLYLGDPAAATATGATITIAVAGTDARLDWVFRRGNQK